MKLDARVLVVLMLVALGILFLAGSQSAAWHFTNIGPAGYAMNAEHQKPCELFGVSFLPESLVVSVTSKDGQELGGKRVWISPGSGFVRFQDVLIRTGNVAVFVYDPVRRPITRTAPPPPSGSAASIEVPLPADSR